MFRLAWQTPPAWVERVAEEPLALLADHAHCELKAAASAQSLILRRPQARELVTRLSAVAREELEHFELVLAELHARGAELGPARESPYAKGLLARAAELGGLDLLGRLLVAALIEARSLERFWLLAEHLPDASLAALYRRLLPSESAHRGLFLSLARAHFPRETVEQRLAALTAAEGELVASLAFEPRMHSGLAGAKLEPRA